MARKVKWGVLGVAKIGMEKVIPAMQRGEVSEIAAIASRDIGRARAAAPVNWTSRSPMAHMRNCWPIPRSRPFTIRCLTSFTFRGPVRALEAGKHVLCEKPIGLNAGEAKSLIEARDRAGRLVAEAFMVRFHPQWRRARELVKSGEIGSVSAIQTFFSYHLVDPENVRNRPPGGGGLYDIGCYAVLTARYIFGAEPVRVAAILDRDPKFETDRLGSAVLEFPGGRHLTFSVGTQLSGHQRVTIVGDKGRIEVLIPFNPPPERPSRIVIDSGKDLIGSGARSEEIPVCDQYTLQSDAFSRAVLGEAPLEFPLEDAVLNMRVIDALFRAAERGSWETP